MFDIQRRALMIKEKHILQRFLHSSIIGVKKMIRYTYVYLRQNRLIKTTYNIFD